MNKQITLYVFLKIYIHLEFLDNNKFYMHLLKAATQLLKKKKIFVYFKIK